MKGNNEKPYGYTHLHPRGITLIVLIIIVIVMLILAGVTIFTIFTITGNNGLIGKVKSSDGGKAVINADFTSTVNENGTSQQGDLGNTANTLMAGTTDNFVFGNTSLTRDKVAKINFSNTNIPPANATAVWDVGEVKDGAVMAWYIPDTVDSTLYDLTIGGVGGVNGNDNSSDLVYNYINLTSIDFTNFSTSKVTNMSGMFLGASSLTSLNLSNFDTLNVTNMMYMFREASGLISLNLSNFYTSNVTSMLGMFEGASSLTKLDLSNFKTLNVTDMGNMFEGASSLISLDLSNFKTSNMINMLRMFAGTSSLTSLDLSGVTISNVTSMDSIFYGTNPTITVYVKDVVTQSWIDANKILTQFPSTGSILIAP